MGEGLVEQMRGARVKELRKKTISAYGVNKDGTVNLWTDLKRLTHGQVINVGIGRVFRGAKRWWAKRPRNLR